MDAEDVATKPAKKAKVKGDRRSAGQAARQARARVRGTPAHAAKLNALESARASIRTKPSRRYTTIVGLARRFKSVGNIRDPEKYERKGLDPWDPERLSEWARREGDAARQCTVAFLRAVVHETEGGPKWNEAFNVVHALCVWSRDDVDTFIEWLREGEPKPRKPAGLGRR